MPRLSLICTPYNPTWPVPGNWVLPRSYRMHDTCFARAWCHHRTHMWRGVESLEDRDTDISRYFATLLCGLPGSWNAGLSVTVVGPRRCNGSYTQKIDTTPCTVVTGEIVRLRSHRLLQQHFLPFIFNYDIWPWFRTFLVSVNMNQHAKYPGQMSFSYYPDTQTHTGQIDLPGPLKRSVILWNICFSVSWRQLEVISSWT